LIHTEEALTLPHTVILTASECDKKAEKSLGVEYG